MPDNITAPAAGAVIATDQIGDVHYQISKLAYGALDTATLVNTTNRLPVAVTFPTTQAVSGAVSVSNFPSTQTVDGTVGVSGPVEVTGAFFQATQPISATALPLPTGAATEAKQDAVITAVAKPVVGRNFFPISPADSDLSTRPEGVYAGGAGTIVARGTDGTDATFTVLAGAILPISPVQVRAASTATGLVGFTA